jgi:hypothetical protein
MKKTILITLLCFFISSTSHSQTLTFEKCHIIGMSPPPPRFTVENHPYSKKNYSKTFEKNIFIVDLKNKNIQQVQIFTDSYLQERNNSSNTFKLKKILTSNFSIKYADKDYINASGKEYTSSKADSVVMNKKNKKITYTTGNQIYEWQCE